MVSVCLSVCLPYFSCVVWPNARARGRVTGDDANGPGHLNVHGPDVRELQQEDARVRDGSGRVPRHRGEA